MNRDHQRQKVRTLQTNEGEATPVGDVTTDNSSTDDEYVYVTRDTKTLRQPMTKIWIAGNPAEVLIDSGASVNLLDEKTYQKVKSNVALERSNKKILPYGTQTPLTLLG